MKIPYLILSVLILIPFRTAPAVKTETISLIVLGTVQDGGSPHIGCRKDCCRELFLHPDPDRKVTALGVIDGTFFDGEEINSRDMTEIPHPFMVETMNLFRDLPVSERNKIRFIHLNHTNPALKAGSEQMKAITSQGFNVARMNKTFTL
jgi:hypothetical protein